MTISKHGTTFSTDDAELIRTLEDIRLRRQRIRVTYDGEYGHLGRDFDFGYVSRTRGNPNAPGGGIKAVLLVSNSASIGGEILVDDHVIKIQESRGGLGAPVIWEKTERHPDFRNSVHAIAGRSQ